MSEHGGQGIRTGRADDLKFTLSVQTHNCSQGAHGRRQPVGTRPPLLALNAGTNSCFVPGLVKPIGLDTRIARGATTSGPIRSSKSCCARSENRPPSLALDLPYSLLQLAHAPSAHSPTACDPLSAHIY